MHVWEQPYGKTQGYLHAQQWRDPLFEAHLHVSDALIPPIRSNAADTGARRGAPGSGGERVLYVAKYRHIKYEKYKN